MVWTSVPSMGPRGPAPASLPTSETLIPALAGSYGYRQGCEAKGAVGSVF